MQALILAAGMGNRLGKYTRNNTKCMLSLNGKTLIERALDAVSGAGIRRCVIVAGYQKENLVSFLGNKYRDVEIDYVFNDVYHKTNNIYSLYLAKDYLVRDDTVLLESDLIFEDTLLLDIVSSPEKNVAAVAKWEAWMDGTVVQLSGDNEIAAFIPKKAFSYDQKETYYKTVNIYKFSREFSTAMYVPFLEAYIQAMGNNEYYEQVLRVIATLDQCGLKAFVLSRQKWYEIDDAQDKDIAETLFAEDSGAKLDLMARRYGVYRRFPGLLDYCYLVNPYFPPPRMRAEIQSYFDTLLTEYPSGLNVQNLLAAKLFNLDEAYILVGNGAAELIRALALSLSGTVGIVYPSFNEYAESFAFNPAVRLASFIPENFAYTKDDVAAYANGNNTVSAECDALLLINPDNPSGNYIARADVIALAAQLKTRGKRLIVDESFVDFADAEEEGTLLQDDVLAAYPNMVVIKSLSKSYGTPGIRLGVLASGDLRLIGNVRKNMSIWNINAFAEYFLQIIGKYQKDYQAACKKIKAERARFGNALRETGLFDVYPSEANYFLCKLKNGMTARRFAETVLAEQEIFIKDLTGKKGIPGDAFIRLAVRDENDNNTFIACVSNLAQGGYRTPPPVIKRQNRLLFVFGFPRFRRKAALVSGLNLTTLAHSR
ncbi:MAG: aminotransferase class I/II-fold pyridoxal phosphate-dependent enzyme [Spirochaetaceae bacterium]|jgi:histidinol-phosphate/aromatic aminotransferase/cobyric acid decarboxylase-like protein/choline kinase|nr:aminotransferase class I/II-fold pyridoxal phosphate-dependent enzyme [Spirochaetaceae bacterium]